MKRFEGKVAVVTGGNSGIGLAAARRLKDEGARVAIVGRSRGTLDEAAKALGRDVLAIQADVSRLADVDRLFREVSERWGKIDVLFVNAGVARLAPLAETSERLYDDNFDTNAKGAFFTIQKALPYLNEGASIVLNTSVAGTQGVANTSAYAATKAALRSFARTAAAELIGRGIRVNAVAPGPITTPILERTGFSPDAIEAFSKELTERVPMKRFGRAEEVAAAVAFLASSDASYITGVELNVDGGLGQV
ncbi:MAG TPA: SDR family oxidoreductase [Polyangia bacterium]|nr:SDR family oxidoreductase [Polyangia bacterium]